MRIYGLVCRLSICLALGSITVAQTASNETSSISVEQKCTRLPPNDKSAPVNESLVLTVSHPDVRSMSFTEDKKISEKGGKRRDLFRNTAGTCLSVKFMSIENGQEQNKKIS